MSIGQIIRQHRERRNWSMQQLGDAIGVSRNAVFLWETSDAPEIKLAHRIKLSEVLDLPIANFMPPHASGKTFQITDPEEILLVDRFRLLLRHQKETVLRLLLAMRGDEPPKD